MRLIIRNCLRRRIRRRTEVVCLMVGWDGGHGRGRVEASDAMARAMEGIDMEADVGRLVNYWYAFN